MNITIENKTKQNLLVERFWNIVLIFLSKKEILFLYSSGLDSQKIKKEKKKKNRYSFF